MDMNDLLTLLASLPSLRSLELRFIRSFSPYSCPQLFFDIRQKLGQGKRPVAMRPKVTFALSGPEARGPDCHASYDLVGIADITELDEFEPTHERSITAASP